MCRRLNAIRPFPPNAARPGTDASPHPAEAEAHVRRSDPDTREIDLPDIRRGADAKGFDLILGEHARLVQMIDLLPLDLTEEIDLGVAMERVVACGAPMKSDDSSRTTSSGK